MTHGTRSVAAVFVLLSFVTSLAAVKKKSRPEPEPDESIEAAMASMTAPAALRHIRQGLQEGAVRVRRGSLFGCVGYRRYKDINVTFSEVSFTEVEECENSRYNSPPSAELLQFAKVSDWQKLNALGNTLGFADAVNAMRYYSSGSDLPADGPMFARFQEEAMAWRALPQKPALPADVQRLSTLAEDSIQNKKFEDALDYYEQALAISPLWPEGQFNVAYLYGELQVYGQAVIHMKRYLELNPDANDAQAARTKVVVWEEKARIMRTQGSQDEKEERPRRAR